MLSLSEFTDLSLKVKINHCIEAFEVFISSHNSKNHNWDEVFRIMKEVNEFQYLDNWFYKFCEILPECILEEPCFIRENDEFEDIKENEFQKLKKLYTESPLTKIANELMLFIHELGSIELYSDSKKMSPTSYKAYTKFMNSIRKNSQ